MCLLIWLFVHLSASSADCLTTCWSVWLPVSLFLSLSLKQTECNYQSDHPSISPSVSPHPPQPNMPHLVSPSVCLSVCQEWEESAAEAAAGRWASVPRCTACGHAMCHSPHIQAFIVFGSSTIIFAIAVAHLFYTAERLACGHGMDNDSHRRINSLQWTGERDWQTPLLLTWKPQM